jgi:hypothetical protein
MGYAARKSLCVCAGWLALSGCGTPAQTSSGLQQSELVRVPSLSAAATPTPVEAQPLPTPALRPFPSIDKATCINCLRNIDEWSR